MRLRHVSLLAIVVATVGLAASPIQSAGVPFYRYTGGRAVDTAPAPVFTAAPASANFQPGGPITASPPPMQGTTTGTTYALLRSGADISTALPSLCTGLSFASPTGVISGTPKSYCSLTNLAYQANTPGQPTAVSDPFSIQVKSSFAVTSQPASMSLNAGSSQSTSATIAGSPYGAITWSVVGPTGDATGVPSWLAPAAGSCGTSSLTCQVSASPAASIAGGTYPASGTYAIRAVDASGTTATSQGFTVAVQGQVPAPVSVGCEQTRDLFVNGAFTKTVSDCNSNIQLAGVTVYTIDLKQEMRINTTNIGGSVNNSGIFEYLNGTTWVAFQNQYQVSASTYAYNATTVSLNNIVVTRYVRWRSVDGPVSGYHSAIALYCVKYSDGSGRGCN